MRGVPLSLCLLLGQSILNPLVSNVQNSSNSISSCLRISRLHHKVMPLSFQQQLCARLGIPAGVASSHNETLIIQCTEAAQRDRIFANVSQLCQVALSMGYLYLTLSVDGTDLVYEYGLDALQALDRQLG